MVLDSKYEQNPNTGIDPNVGSMENYEWERKPQGGFLHGKDM